ncbi:hypothetical protein PHYBOEH_000156 [Phytophthora boehmeriae]|uniref:Ion transport domain-containing protein n=1 Tax=Phytophthora boehmeriae TaxID=109152 RepID=A0A8T1X8E5_9STRA|nr:hypothetical protein PHYBOEH_000156 [Phytophthora boehmeriae]
MATDTVRRQASTTDALDSPTRDELIEAYRSHIKASLWAGSSSHAFELWSNCFCIRQPQERRAIKKKHLKGVILEDARKRTPRLQLKHEPVRPQHSRPHHKTRKPESNGVDNHKARVKSGNYLKNFLAGHFSLHRDERPEGWAAAKINQAMRRYYRMNLLLTKRDERYLALQNKLLFDECCRCKPLAPGPVRTESGVLRVAEPNLPKILQILRNEANDGLDLLQPHGLAQYTAMHAAAQRGYTTLVEELIAHWNTHPMSSPYEQYSFVHLSHLLELIFQMRKAKRLVSESNAEIRALVANIGVPFTRFSDSLDKLNDNAVTLQDLLQICGHPLVISKDAAGNTPLHYAAEGGHLTLSKILIENGANINAQNAAGETPLHFAIASQRHGVCTHLVTHYADHVFALADDEAAHKENIVCEPKGILLEYIYDHAEFRGRLSPAMWLIVKTECKELLFHPWFRQLLDHKWDSFTRQTFRSEFHVYFVYFVAVFVATYLHIGDTLLGMPTGGYRDSIFNGSASCVECLEGCKSYFTAVTTTLNISVGSWNWDSIYEGGLLAIFFFIAYVVVGTIMLLNLLVAMMGNTYDKVWEDRLLFFEIERAKATLSIQSSLDDDVYDEKYWCQRLYVLEGDTPIEGIQYRRL